MVQYHENAFLVCFSAHLVLNLLQAIFCHLGFRDSWGLKRTDCFFLVPQKWKKNEPPKGQKEEIHEPRKNQNEKNEGRAWEDMGSIDFFVPCLCCLCFCKLLFELRLGEAQKKRKRKHLNKVEQAIQRHEILCSIMLHQPKKKRHKPRNLSPSSAPIEGLSKFLQTPATHSYENRDSAGFRGTIRILCSCLPYSVIS